MGFGILTEVDITAILKKDRCRYGALPHLGGSQPDDSPQGHRDRTMNGRHAVLQRGLAPS